MRHSLLWLAATVAVLAVGVAFLLARLQSQGYFAMPPQDPFIYPEQQLQDQPLGAPKAPPDPHGD